MYNVKVERHVSKYIQRLGKKQEESLIERFNKLKYNKSGYKILDAFRGIELWELRCSSHRIYYTVEDRFIVISNIEYDGSINVSLAGNKNTQRKDIDYMKDKMRN
jgi:mRNA-degrading endonuclease RelE of RelBE toxin-antitoxin system